MSFIVYRHTNLNSGLSYVGMTSKTMHERWRCHVKIARCKPRYHFHRALAKYGLRCWKHEVLQTCETVEAVKSAEVRWITRLRAQGECGYNSTVGGDGVMLGRTFSVEARARMSVSRTGVKRSAQARANIGAAQRNLDPVKRSRIIDASRKAHFKRVARCDLSDGQILEVYQSVVAANARGYEKTSVSAAARGLRPQFKGFAWRYLPKETSL